MIDGQSHSTRERGSDMTRIIRPRRCKRTSNCVPAVSGCKPKTKPPTGSSTCGGGTPNAGRGKGFVYGNRMRWILWINGQDNFRTRFAVRGFVFVRASGGMVAENARAPRRKSRRQLFFPGHVHWAGVMTLLKELQDIFEEGSIAF